MGLFSRRREEPRGDVPFAAPAAPQPQFAPPPVPQQRPAPQAGLPPVAQPPARQRTGGPVGFYGLEQWWFSELSEADRHLLRDRFQPMGSSPGADHFTSGHDMVTSQTASCWITNLAGWFKPAEPVEADLILRLADKAWELKDWITPPGGADGVFSRHLALGALSDIYYRFREDPARAERALHAAHLQIEMQTQAAIAWRQKEAFLMAQLGRPVSEPPPLPSHPGYTRMAIVLEKEKRYDDALAVVRQAQESEWCGDWDKRIERLGRKIAASS